MNRLVIKNVDIGAKALDTYHPLREDNFCVWVTLLIGQEEVEGGELFQVGICTPSWLSHRLSIDQIYALQHLILVEKFDAELIERKLMEIVSDAVRPTWDESVRVLCRNFSWEFDDYKSL